MSNKTCVIVGMGRGVSMGVARRFGREGFQLSLIARRQDALDMFVSELAENNIVAHGFAADASDSAALVAAFDQIKANMGDVDVLVYNAAVIRQEKPASLDPEDLIADFQVNVGSALLSAQYVIPDMKKRGSGTILFTGGGLAINPNPDWSSLAIGKAGLRSLAYSLGAELESYGIQVATVTIAGYVQPGTYFDPDKIAEAYWTLHNQAEGKRQREIIYKKG